MNKEAWEQLTPKEKDKMIEERITGKPGNYSRDWNAAMWLIRFIMGDHSAVFSILFEEYGFSSELVPYAIASWEPSDVCYAVICALDEK